MKMLTTLRLAGLADRSGIGRWLPKKYVILNQTHLANLFGEATGFP